MKKWRIFLTVLMIVFITVTLYIAASDSSGAAGLLPEESVQSEKTISPGDDIQQAIDSLPDGDTRAPSPWKPPSETASSLKTQELSK